jgi:hypothetical protein
MSRIVLDAGATAEGVCPTASHFRVLRDDEADLKSRLELATRTGATGYSGTTVANHTSGGLHGNIGFGQLPRPAWNLYGEWGAMAPTVSVGGNRVCYGRELVSPGDVTARGTVYLPDADAVDHEGGAIGLQLNSDVDTGAIFSAEVCIQNGERTVRVEALDLATLSVDPATVSNRFAPAKIGDA